MSTSGDTVRWPQRASRSTIQAGVVARVLTPRRMRPVKRPHKSGACTLTGRRSLRLTGTAGNTGSTNGEPVSAATSRAMPYTLRQCARLGVSLRVNSMSSSNSCSRMLRPTTASGASSSRPPWSSANCSSLDEHSMPWLSTPRSLPNLIKKGLPSSPGGSAAPTVAQGTRMPARALGAPHTILSGCPCPTSTWQTRKRSALGCCTASRIRPTTTPLNGGATGSSSSTSRPAMVKVSASCWLVRGGLQKARSQDSGNCMEKSQQT